MIQKVIAVLLVLIALALVVLKFYRQMKGTSGSSCPFCDKACNTEDKDEDRSSPPVATDAENEHERQE